MGANGGFVAGEGLLLRSQSFFQPSRLLSNKTSYELCSAYAPRRNFPWSNAHVKRFYNPVDHLLVLLRRLPQIPLPHLRLFTTLSLLVVLGRTRGCAGLLLAPFFVLLVRRTVCSPATTPSSSFGPFYYYRPPVLRSSSRGCAAARFGLQSRAARPLRPLSMVMLSSLGVVKYRRLPK